MIEILLALSIHSTSTDFNQVHPHIRLNYDNWVTGVFYNSEDRLGIYAGREFESNKWFLDAGLVYGYKMIDFPVVPMVRGGYKIKDNVKLFAAPYYDGFVEKPGVLGGIEFRFF